MIEFKLAHPIVGRTWVGTENKIEVVLVRIPLLKDILHMKSPPDNYDTMKLVSNVTNIPEAALKEMSLSDYNKLCKVVTALMTGEK